MSCILVLLVTLMKPNEPSVLEELQDCYPSVSVDQINDLERKVQCQLPKDYKKFLLKTNGGHFRHLVDCPLEEPGTFVDNARPDAFLCLGQKTFDGVDSIEYMQGIVNERIPGRWLPIASCFNNVILLSLDRDTFGKIYIWDTVLKEVPTKNVHLVAGSFTQYLQNLRPSPERTNWREQDPIFVDVELGRIAKIEQLLATQGEVDVRSFTGKTLLMSAAQAPWPRLVKLLLERGANVHAVDKEGKSPLHHAAEGHSVDCLRLVLEAGGDCLAKDSRGLNPLEHLYELYGRFGPDSRARALLRESTKKAKKS